MSDFYCSPCGAYHPRDCVHERPAPEETFTGLTLDDINRLVNHHFVRGRAAGRKAGYDEGFAHGQAAARNELRRAVEERIQRVVGGRLIHVVSGLTEVANRRRKTTIADEREWMASKAQEVQRAIADLRELP